MPQDEPKKLTGLVLTRRLKEGVAFYDERGAMVGSVHVIRTGNEKIKVLASAPRHISVERVDGSMQIERDKKKEIEC